MKKTLLIGLLLFISSCSSSTEKEDMNNTNQGDANTTSEYGEVSEIPEIVEPNEQEVSESYIEGLDRGAPNLFE
ncbi:hypothetical protein GW846_04465 [Candidatus Gracilibacteria bacterium]|nr:hypothetical protein [Candidatus Gracilibacteria bacterium]